MFWRHGQISKEVQIESHSALLDAQQEKPMSREAMSIYSQIKGLNVERQTFKYPQKIYYKRSLVRPI